MASQLRQWPVQLHLLNPHAGYFQGADVLLAADCAAFAAGNFHSVYLKNKVLAIACPKLDDGKDSYIAKLTAMINESNINTLTVVRMALKLLTYSNLNCFDNQIGHFSSTRSGGVSAGEYASLNLGNFSDDSRDNILHNRRLLCDVLGIPFSHLVGAHQVHGSIGDKPTRLVEFRHNQTEIECNIRLI